MMRYITREMAVSTVVTAAKAAASPRLPRFTAVYVPTVRVMERLL